VPVFSYKGRRSLSLDVKSLKKMTHTSLGYMFTWGWWNTRWLAGLGMLGSSSTDCKWN